MGRGVCEASRPTTPMSLSMGVGIKIRSIYGRNKRRREKAALTNKLRQGDDFYARIGRKGGKNGNSGGFAANRELARIAGAKGGSISRRGSQK